MKHWILTILFIGFIGSTLPAIAQDITVNAKKAEQLEALKIAFINRKLALTPEEAQRFWPVYTQYENELQAVQKTSTPDQLAIDQARLDVKKKYKDQFSKVIGQPRMNQLFQTENDFKRMLLNQLRNREQRPNARPGKPF